MSLRPLVLGLAAASLAGCPKKELPNSSFPDTQDSQIEEAPLLEDETGGIDDRFQAFLTELSKSEGRVGPMTSEIRSFSEGEVTQGMLARYQGFSDQWWEYVNEFNQARSKGAPLILPAEPIEAPVFTEMIVPIVRGMELTPAERRTVLEDYRYRTLKGLRNDMERLFVAKLQPIAPHVLRGNPEALVSFEAYKSDFDALEEHFMLFQYLDFAQILGIEHDQFEEMTTAQEEVVAYSKTLKIPETLREAAPLLEEVSQKLDEYQSKLGQYNPNSAEYDDVLKAIMMLMELQTRLTSMVLDQVGTPYVQGATVIGDEFEMILKAPRTPLGRFDLEVTTSTWKTEPDDSNGVYSGQWSKWAEWYSATFYYLAMRHFDEQRAEGTQQGLEDAYCESLGHGDCVNEPSDSLKGWADSLSLAQRALSDDYPIEDIYRFAPTEPPIYSSTGVDFDFPEYPVSVRSYAGGQETRLNISDGDLVFPAYCGKYPTSYKQGENGDLYVYDSHSPYTQDIRHFPVAFQGFTKPDKIDGMAYSRMKQAINEPCLDLRDEYRFALIQEIPGIAGQFCPLPPSPPDPFLTGGRRAFPRTDETLTVLGGLETMTVGFCAAEEAFKPEINRTLGFSNLAGPRLYASCIVDGCEGQTAGHTLPVDFFEQLARESIARSWDTTAAVE